MSDTVMIFVDFHQLTCASGGRVHVETEDGKTLCGRGPFEWSWKADPRVYRGDELCRDCERALSEQSTEENP